MSAHAKMLQLVARLLDRGDVAPGGDGLALSLSLFSKAAFRGLLQDRRAHEAFLYLLPFLRRERGSLHCDAEQESGALWTLHDALLERALADSPANEAELRGCSLRGIGVACSPTAPARTDDQLVALLHELHTLGLAMENWERAAADGEEDLVQFVSNALRSQQRIAELEDEVKALRARVSDAEKQQNSPAQLDPRPRMVAQKLHQDAHWRKSERPSRKRPSGTSPQDTRPSKRDAASARECSLPNVATPNDPLAPGARQAGVLGIRRTLLHAGCSTREAKANMRIYPGLSLEVHRMIQYISMSEQGDHFEVLLVLQRSGRMLCFKRPWTHASTEGPIPPVVAADQVTLLGPESGVLAGVESFGADRPPSMVRLGNLDKIVVCVGEVVCMYESHLERLASGLKVETKLERAFRARLPPPIHSSNARAIAHHPVDKNLYAVSTGNGAIVVQSFHLHDQFQMIPAEKVPGVVVPPPLIEFSTSGNLFISVSTRQGLLGVPAVHLQTREVPKHSLAPHSNAVVQRGDCANVQDFLRKRAEEKEKNKQVLEKWVEEYQTHNRGSALLPSECFDSAKLPQGMPVRIVPLRKWAGRQYDDFALLSWQTEVEVWKLRPVERVAWRKMVGCACTAVFAFDTLDGGQYWFVGTSQAQLHVISAWTTTQERELNDVKIVQVLPQGSAAKAITAISTLNDVLLYIGFDDGSVRAYSMDELLKL